MKEKRVMSLFSGCGGMDLGFEGGFSVFKNSVNINKNSDWIAYEDSNETYILKKNSYKIVFANDINKYAKIAWLNYFSKYGYSDTIYNSESIVDIINKFYNNDFEFPKNIDVLTGGFPCQDFSLAGKRLGFSSIKNHKGEIKKTINEENRGNLYVWMKKTIEIVKPKIFIAENVKGLISLKNAKELIIQDFSKANDNDYLIIEPKVLLSANYGIPQSRERIIFIGFSKNALNKKALEALSKEIIPDIYDPYPVITHINKKKYFINKLLEDKYLYDYVSSKDVFCGLKEPDKSDDSSQKAYSKAKYLSNGSQGQIEIDLDGITPTIRSEHHGNIEFRRLSTFHGGKHKEELDNGLQERRLTVRECARLQTFPDDYQFVFNYNSFNLSPSEAYKRIGNAVPPLLAYHIAKRLEQKWNLYFGDISDNN
jgi:DNA (cytosine-5)-methyltransferase 1